MLAFVYSKDDGDLSGNVKMFHDYPPVEIKDTDLDATFSAFFGQSSRQLITVHDETH